MSFLNNDRNFNISILFIIFIYIISRLLFLEADVPTWKIGYYQSIDEFYYTIGAFNLYHYNDYDVKLIEYLSEPKYVTNYFMELLVFISLKFFGNNYYGLRMASVFAGAVILFFSYKILMEYIKNDKKYRWIVLITILYMIIDFSFNLSNKIAEPTIFRLLAFICLFYITLKVANDGFTIKKSFLLGFLASSSVILVYTTNFFILPTIGLYVLYLSIINKNNIFISLMVYLFGIIVFFIIFICIYQYVFDSNYIKDFIWVHSVVTNRINNYLLNFTNIFLTNTFQFNLGFLFLFFVSLPLFIYIMLTKITNVDILLFISIFMFILQTIFINDYPQRKLIFIFPLIVLMCTITILNRKLILEQFLNRKIIKYTMYLYIIFVFIGLCLFYNDKDNLNLLNYVSIISVFIVILFYLNILSTNAVLYLSMIFLFLPNFVFNYKYIYSKPSFKYKIAMQEVASIIDNKYTIGWSHGIRLYNKSRPIMSEYLYNHWEKNNLKTHIKYLIDQEKIVYKVIYTNDLKEFDEVICSLDINEVTGQNMVLVRLK